MIIFSKKPIAMVIATVLLAACMSSTKPTEEATLARNKLTALQSDPQLASRAPVALQEAERAVVEAEKPQRDKALGQHLALMADRKVEIANARAHTKLFEEQREAMGDDRQNDRLASRTREADNARNDANNARIDANEARNETDIAQEQNSDLQLQIIALNAKKTDRGLVVTLGDLLFDTGKSDLKAGAENHLDKLAVFLNKYTDSSVIIEGHTDSVGSNDANFGLSQRRAAAVKSWLVGQGVNSSRLTTLGKGEGTPIADNDSVSGRQQNRRVEVIISNTAVSSR